MYTSTAPGFDTICYFRHPLGVLEYVPCGHRGIIVPQTRHIFKTPAHLFDVASASYVFVEFSMIIILQQSPTEYGNGDQLQLQSSRLRSHYNSYAVISTYPGEQARVLMQTDCSCSHQALHVPSIAISSHAFSTETTVLSKAWKRV